MSHELSQDEQFSAVQKAVKTNGNMSAEELQVHYPLLSLDEITAVKSGVPFEKAPDVDPAPEVQTVEAPVMVVAPEPEPVEKEGE